MKWFFLFFRKKIKKFFSFQILLQKMQWFRFFLFFCEKLFSLKISNLETKIAFLRNMNHFSVRFWCQKSNSDVFIFF
jgi:hypothetical protein